LRLVLCSKMSPNLRLESMPQGNRRQVRRSPHSSFRLARPGRRWRYRLLSSRTACAVASGHCHESTTALSLRNPAKGCSHRRGCQRRHCWRRLFDHRQAQDRARGSPAGLLVSLRRLNPRPVLPRSLAQHQAMSQSRKHSTRSGHCLTALVAAPSSGLRPPSPWREKAIRYLLPLGEGAPQGRMRAALERPLDQSQNQRHPTRPGLQRNSAVPCQIRSLSSQSLLRRRSGWRLAIHRQSFLCRVLAPVHRFLARFPRLLTFRALQSLALADGLARRIRRPIPSPNPIRVHLIRCRPGSLHRLIRRQPGSLPLFCPRLYPPRRPVHRQRGSPRCPVRRWSYPRRRPVRFRPGLSLRLTGFPRPRQSPWRRMAKTDRRLSWHCSRLSRLDRFRVQGRM